MKADNERNYEDEFEEYAREDWERQNKIHEEALQKAKDSAAKSIGFGLWINVTMNPHLIDSEKLEKLATEIAVHYNQNI